MKRVLTELHMEKIAAVDRPAQEGAKMVIMKRAPTPTRAIGFWSALEKVAPDEFALSILGRSLDSIMSDESLDVAKRAALVETTGEEFRKHCGEKIGDITPGVAERAEEMLKSAITLATDAEREADAKRKKQEREERERRAASARQNLSHPYDAKKGFSDMTAITTRGDALAAMTEIAKAAQEPKQSLEQAYAKAMKTDPRMQKLYAMSKSLPADAPAEPAQRSILKGVTAPTAAYGAILDKATEIRKAEPKLSEAQAFSKAWKDPANASLVAAHKRAEAAAREAA